MKFRTQKITALMASAIVGVSTLGSVSVMAAESTEAMADQAGMGVDRDAIAADGLILYRVLLNRPRQLCRHRILMSIHSLDLT